MVNVDPDTAPNKPDHVPEVIVPTVLKEDSVVTSLLTSAPLTGNVTEVDAVVVKVKLLPPTVANVDPFASVNVALVAGSVMVTLLTEVAEATPNDGAIKVGPLLNTTLPEPVSSEINAANSEEFVKLIPLMTSHPDAEYCTVTDLPKPSSCSMASIPIVLWPGNITASRSVASAYTLIPLVIVAVSALPINELVTVGTAKLPELSKLIVLRLIPFEDRVVTTNLPGTLLFVTAASTNAPTVTAES